MSKEKRFKLEQNTLRSEVSVFLKQFAESLEQGNLVLKGEEKEVILEIPEEVNFEIEVKEKTKEKGTQKTLEIELKWY